MYTISGQDVIKDISHVRGYVIRDASHKKEGVARDKTDEENRILDTKDAQENVTTDPNGEGEAGADPESVTGVRKTKLRGEEGAERGHQSEEGPYLSCKYK